MTQTLSEAMKVAENGDMLVFAYTDMGLSHGLVFLCNVNTGWHLLINGERQPYGFGHDFILKYYSTFAWGLL